MPIIRRLLANSLLPVLLVSLALPGCAPLDGAGPDPADQQTRERLASLKQQLQELQEELARSRAEQALAAAAPDATAERAWQAFNAASPVPEGYAQYAYLLLAPASTETDRIILATLLGILPGRGDLPPAEQNLLLVPGDEGSGEPLQRGDAQLAAAAALLAPYRDQLGSRTGPFLVLSERPLPNTDDRVMILDLAGRSAPFLKQLLADLQQRQTPGPSSLAERQGRRLLTLAGFPAGSPLTLSASPGAILVTWAP